MVKMKRKEYPNLPTNIPVAAHLGGFNRTLFLTLLGVLSNISTI